MTVTNWYNYLVPLWLLGILFAVNIAPENQQIASLIALIWLAGASVFITYGGFFKRNSFNELNQQKKAFVYFFLFSFVSSILSEWYLTALQQLFVTAIMIWICSGVWFFLRERMAESLALYALLGAVTLIFVLILYGLPVDGERLGGDMRNSNGLALIALSILACSFLINNKVLNAIVALSMLLLIILTGSRSGLGASVILLSIFAFYRWKSLRSELKGLVLFIIVLFISLLILGFFQKETQYVAQGLFATNDEHRGLGTNFTGRSDAWQFTFDLWKDNPWFGVGYRMHEQYFTGLTSWSFQYEYEISSSHNGYLGVLSEIGVIGIFPVIFIFYFGIKRLLFFSNRGDALSQISIALIASYLFIAVFERYMINVGNPTSVLVMLLLMRPDLYFSRIQGVVRKRTRKGKLKPIHTHVGRGGRFVAIRRKR